MQKSSLLCGVIPILALMVWTRISAAEAPKEADATRASAPGSSVAVETGLVCHVNLGDYAKGDGSDETEAIQRAIDALVAPQDREQPWLNNYAHRWKKGVLRIPAPAKFYGISRTVKILEKWNVLIQAETPTVYAFPYFKWLGKDDGSAMFEFVDCGGIRVENLSLSGNGKKVIGVRIGGEDAPLCSFKHNVFDNLNIANVAVGLKVGDHPDNGPDIALNTFQDVRIDSFTEYGLMIRSGNIADTTFLNLTVSAAGGVKGVKDAIRIDGGEIVVVNSAIGSCGNDAEGAAVAVTAGGIHIIGCWSEWSGPFLKGYPCSPAPPDQRSDSHARFSVILEGIAHYPPLVGVFEQTPGSTNPAAVAVDWGQSKPLTLINCSFRGKVRMAEESQSTIIDIGTVFTSSTAVEGGTAGIERGYEGPGIEKYGRLIKIGTTSPENRNVVEPYVVDRRNTPGTKAPETGVWKRGDRILNVVPDPSVPANAWAGWICIETGEPGKWAPFGAIGK
ncbi:MAG: hypothetical protein PHR35_01685 [Kiritimatiellae bacterium]|nr:hypothetical protein [Kiritimatiellia bacterium]